MIFYREYFAPVKCRAGEPFIINAHDPLPLMKVSHRHEGSYVREGAYHFNRSGRPQLPGTAAADPVRQSQYHASIPRSVGYFAFRGDQLKAMSAIERCRTAALGGRVASATMACSPAANAPRTSRAPASCSRRQCFRSMPSKRPAPKPPNRNHQSIPAPVAAARMIIIETFARGCQPKHQPTPTPAAVRIDTS
jgi:hypothetical protein